MDDSGNELESKQPDKEFDLHDTTELDITELSENSSNIMSSRIIELDKISGTILKRVKSIISNKQEMTKRILN